LFTWQRIDQTALTFHPKATPRAVILTSPYIPWDQLASRWDLVAKWATVVSVVPYTEEVGQSVVDVLLQIASVRELVQSIPVDVWLWLTKRPPLPPICMGRYVGTRSRVVRAVRAIKDPEVHKSYLLVVWSEWCDLRGRSALNQMCALIREDFSGSGIEMEHHRAELLQELARVLGQLDRGFPSQSSWWLGRYDLWKAKRRYMKLKEEVERRAFFPMTVFFRVLTPLSIRGISCDVRPRPFSPVQIVSPAEPSV